MKPQTVAVRGDGGELFGPEGASAACRYPIRANPACAGRIYWWGYLSFTPACGGDGQGRQRNSRADRAEKEQTHPPR